MVISRDIIYTNLDNVLVADVLDEYWNKILKFICMKIKKVNIKKKTDMGIIKSLE